MNIYMIISSVSIVIIARRHDFSYSINFHSKSSLNLNRTKKGKKGREREICRDNTSRERNIVAVEKKKKKRIILRHSRPSFLLLLYENDDIKNIIFTPMKLREDQRKEKRKRRKIGYNIKTRKDGCSELRSRDRATRFFDPIPASFLHVSLAPSNLITQHLRRVPSLRFSTPLDENLESVPL